MSSAKPIAAAETAPALGRVGPEPPPDLRPALLRSMDALHRYILVRVGFDDGIAEEILQQTACAALHQPNAPRIDEEQEWWLRGIARNLIRRHWRVERRAKERTVRPGNGERLLQLVESDGPVDEPIDAGEQRDLMLTAIADLSSGDQWLLYEFYRHGRTRNEIATVLGTSLKGVEARLYRMRGRLRAAILGEAGDQP